MTTETTKPALVHPNGVTAINTQPETQPEVAPVKPKRDPRVLALQRFAMSISAFTILGHIFFGFEQAPITPIVGLLVGYASAIGFEALDAWAYNRQPDFAGGARALGVFLLPAHIGALACSMLLYGNSSLWPYLFAIIVGNASKYVVRLRIKGKLRHVLNPSNTGIAVTLVLFDWVGIAPPYHFTNWLHGALSWLIPVGILMLGTMLNAKLTKKTPLIAAWVGGFVLQALVRWLVLDHALVGALLPMTGVAFILYTNYMITDPGSTPSAPRGQVVFGFTAAVVYGVLVSFGIVFGLFFALVITCLLRGGVLLVARARGRVPA
ncbi:enediyne biosynthesis protein UnbU [Actinokineospora globicatena]|uniref:enediyne biosynthesis protein UnbU n=1 Tax=Actinokineospora globicatena TaxID=103729 RepID=UPI0025569403|nr:enediyne biosynthesis protein UnbU [Actinokineospora globicatena]